MTPKAVIENRDYHLLETVPLLSGQEKFVLCEDSDGNRFVCPEDFWLRHTPTPEEAAPVRADSTSQEKIDCFLSLLRGREGLYAKRYYNLKSGKSGYVPVCQNEWVPGICDKKAYRCPECPNRAFKPLTAQVVRAHLMGKDEFCRDVVGIYPMLENDCTWLLAKNSGRRTCPRFGKPAFPSALPPLWSAPARGTARTSGSSFQSRSPLWMPASWGADC